MVYKYKLNDQIYTSEWALRDALPNVSFPYLDDENRKEVCEWIGVELIEEPDPEPTEEDLLRKAKDIRDDKVNSLVVEVDGMQFDGDEVSQTRMARALKVADLLKMDKTTWVLADNTVAEVTKSQLERALTASILKQSALWTEPYETKETENEAS